MVAAGDPPSRKAVSVCKEVKNNCQFGPVEGKKRRENDRKEEDKRRNLAPECLQSDVT